MKVFVLEDDLWYSKMLSHIIGMNPDNEVTIFNNAKSFFDSLHENPDLITLDLSLPDSSGEEVLLKIKQINNSLPVIVISASEDVKLAISLLQKGAYDYILKDNDTKDRLWKAISNLNEVIKLKDEVEELHLEIEKKYDFSKLIIGNSDSIKKTYEHIIKASKTNINVSITGETGTGKEMVAKSIHYSSERKKKPFVAVNVSSIPKDLLESELFGHEKGSFTGAMSRRIGKFEEANGGTLFLDEIGDLDIALQAKLLRVLQERELVRVGGNATIKLDVRIITATHKNLLSEVKNKHFREDLYYRIIGYPIELSPIRERENDVIILAKYFADEFCKLNKLHKKSFTISAQNKLLAYKFPGNIRELKSIIELAVVLSDDTIIEDFHINIFQENSMENLFNKEKTLKEYELTILQYYLEKYNNDILKVAEILDVSKSKLYNLINENKLTT